MAMASLGVGLAVVLLSLVVPTPKDNDFASP
jgi:hypothetical protein